MYIAYDLCKKVVLTHGSDTYKAHHVVGKPEQESELDSTASHCQAKD